MGVAFILCGLSFVILIAARSVLLGRSAAWLFLRVACRLQPPETPRQQVTHNAPRGMATDRRQQQGTSVDVSGSASIAASVPTSTFRSADWPRPAGVPTIRHGAASD